jgi:hypothetical protein
MEDGKKKELKKKINKKKLKMNRKMNRKKSRNVIIEKQMKIKIGDEIMNFFVLLDILGVNKILDKKDNIEQIKANFSDTLETDKVVTVKPK